MDCICSQKMFLTLKSSTEDQTYLTFAFVLQYNLVLEKEFFCFPGNYAGQGLHTKVSSELTLRGFC